MHIRFFSLAALSVLLPWSMALAESGHGAHVHGHASLNIIIDGNAVYMELESPAANIVGFEHQPHDDGQRARLTQAIANLKNAQEMFGFGTGACVLQTTMVETGLVTDEGHGNDTQGHSDFEAEYLFQCLAVERLDYIDVNVFDVFPGIEALEVTLLKGTLQTSMELTAQQRRIQW